MGATRSKEADEPIAPGLTLRSISRSARQIAGAAAGDCSVETDVAEKISSVILAGRGQDRRFEAKGHLKPA
jgi:hypothetical protein